MSIGKRIREVRIQRGLTQAQLAAKVGIAQPTLSELERGDSAGTGNIATFASILGVNALWLETGKGPRNGLALREASNEDLPIEDHLQRVNYEEYRILMLFRCTDDDGRADILRHADLMKKIFPSSVRGNKL